MWKTLSSLKHVRLKIGQDKTLKHSDLFYSLYRYFMLKSVLFFVSLCSNTE